MQSEIDQQWAAIKNTANRSTTQQVNRHIAEMAKKCKTSQDLKVFNDKITGVVLAHLRNDNADLPWLRAAIKSSFKTIYDTVHGANRVEQMQNEMQGRLTVLNTIIENSYMREPSSLQQSNQKYPVPTYKQANAPAAPLVQSSQAAPSTARAEVISRKASVDFTVLHADDEQPNNKLSRSASAESLGALPPLPVEESLKNLAAAQDTGASARAPVPTSSQKLISDHTRQAFAAAQKTEETPATENIETQKPHK